MGLIYDVYYRGGVMDRDTYHLPDPGPSVEYAACVNGDGHRLVPARVLVNGDEIIAAMRTPTPRYGRGDLNTLRNPDYEDYDRSGADEAVRANEGLMRFWSRDERVYRWLHSGRIEATHVWQWA